MELNRIKIKLADLIDFDLNKEQEIEYEVLIKLIHNLFWI